MTAFDLAGRPRVVAVVGATGSGKTALALQLAARLQSEILSADSMQFYRGMEIGTAAPTAAEQAQIPHHFVGFLRPDEEMNAGSYGVQSRALCRSFCEKGTIPVVAGGSGLYVSALIDGIFDGPGRDDTVRRTLQAEAAALGSEALFARLQQVDPDYAASLTSANDVVRVVRALEVFSTTGTPLSAMHAEHRAQAEPFDALRFALHYPDRAVLYERINLRVDAMVQAGWIAEVERLVASGYGPQLERLKALGYREIAGALRGEKSMDAAIEATKMHHRRYAKRQLTWFRADPGVHWIDTSEHTTAAAQVAEAWARMAATWNS